MFAAVTVSGRPAAALPVGVGVADGICSNRLAQNFVDVRHDFGHRSRSWYTHR